MKGFLAIIFLTVGISSYAQLEEQIQTEVLFPGDSVVAYDYSTQSNKKFECSANSWGNRNPQGPRDPRGPRGHGGRRGSGHPRGPINNNEYYQNLSDELVYNAARGGELGDCKITMGGRGSKCNYYVKLKGVGYPNGTGCTGNRYSNYQQGQYMNAILTIREMLRKNLCFF